MEIDEKMYPTLTDQGKVEATNLVKLIIDNVKKELDDSSFYQDIPCYIESDSWCNFKNSIMDGFKDYSNAKLRNEYNFKDIRRSMLRDNYEEIIKDINQDNLDQIKELERTIAWMKKFENRY